MHAPSVALVCCAAPAAALEHASFPLTRLVGLFAVTWQRALSRVQPRGGKTQPSIADCQSERQTTLVRYVFCEYRLFGHLVDRNLSSLKCCVGRN